MEKGKKVTHGIKCFKCRKRTEILKIGVGFICYECKPEVENDKVKKSDKLEFDPLFSW